MAQASIKKTAPKKKAAPKKESRKKSLVYASPECSFWVYNGPILGSLEELAHALEDAITDEQFSYHVTPEKNDFAAWAADILLDPACARSLRKAKTKKMAARAAIACLKKYS